MNFNQINNEKMKKKYNFFIKFKMIIINKMKNVFIINR